MKMLKKFICTALPVCCVCLGLGVASLNASATGTELTDGSFDSGSITAWTGYSWTGNDTSNTRAWDNEDCNGSDTSGSIKLACPNQDHQYVGQQITLTAGVTYTLSAMMKTEGATSSGGGATGMYLDLTNASGTLLAWIGYYESTTIGTTGWTAFSTNVTISETATYNVAMKIWGASGTVWVDDISLAEAEDGVIADGAFANGNLNAWEFWSGNSGTAQRTLSSESHTADGSGSLLITNNPTDTSSHADTQVYLLKNTQYTISGYIKLGTDFTAQMANNAIGAYLAINTNKVAGIIFEHSTAVDSSYYNWAYYEGTYTPTETGMYEINCMLWGSTGSAFFDDISVSKYVPEIALSFKACNLSLQDNIHIQYAVSTENVANENVKVLVWTAPQTTYTYGTQDTVIEYDANNSITLDATYPVYAYTELSMKEMTDVVYACVYAEVGGQEFYSEPLKYSILEYAYNMLGYTDKTPTTTTNLKTLLNDLLKLGASMQTYLGYNTESLPTDDFTYVSIANATFEDGFNYGLFKAGTKVRITLDEGCKLSDSVASYITVNGDEIILTVPEEKTVDKGSIINPNA